MLVTDWSQSLRNDPISFSMKIFRTLAGGLVLSAVLAAAPIRSYAITPEAAPIEALNAGLIATMKAGSANASFISRYQALEPVVKSAFNLQVILQNSTGFYWATFPAAQQQELSKLFEQFTIASYITGFNGYGGQSFKVSPTERDVGASKVVESQLVPGDGSDPVELDYVMTDGAAGWQVTDVLLNGTISKVAIQSSDFGSEVSSGDASQLIAALKAKVATLSGGALTN
jgi:phospholipid transport system substrate-binding protein